MAETAAFVIKRVEYGDRDLIITFLSRDHGKFSALAKNARGSRTRFGGGIEPFRVLNIDFKRKRNNDFAYLNSIELIKHFCAIEQSYENISLSSYATELAGQMAPEKQLKTGEAVFDLLRHFLNNLSRHPGSPLRFLLLAKFELQLLRLHGAQPAISACFRCRKPVSEMDKVRAARNGSGIICNNCIRKGDRVGVLSEKTLNLLHKINHLDDKISSLDPNPLNDQLRRFIDTSIQTFLEKRLKSRDMLEPIL